MSFLDHLEELRIRLFKSIAAITVGFVGGWFLVDRYHGVTLLKAPIAPFLPGGKLVVLSPTEPLMIELKLALILGCILASPVVLWQVWAFLSPALYQRERKVVVPALVAGMALFLSGAACAFIFVVPQALRVLFSFQSDALATMITFEKYFDFVTQLMLAMGLSFELPLVMIILASFGIISPSGISAFRRVAIIVSMVAGAILSPGTDVFSMLMLCVPMILLYEVGYVGAILVTRRRARSAAKAAMILLLLGLGGAHRLDAQVPPAKPPAGQPGTGILGRQGVADSAGRKQGVLDSASARRLGLPTGPSRDFPPTDSVLDALLARPGYEATRFLADSATLFVPERRIDLQGRAMTRRNGSTLEAARIAYEEESCEMDARGDPKVFDQGTVLVGEGLRYNTCERRAVVSGALTNFQQGGVEWFMRGTLSQDSTAHRIYATTSQITSCDLPIAHYHFQARQSKWISKSVLVARPAVLYVRDVPTLWLPFIFQDGRPGRHSGILVPQFGLNDIVRPSKTYARQVTNIGYFWAPNPYFDATVRFDWYAGRQTQAGLGLQYRWIDRAITGSVGIDRLARFGEPASLKVDWTHSQVFSLTSRLAIQASFVSSPITRSLGAINQLSNTQQMSSSATYDKRFGWGQFTVGGNRREDLNTGAITQQFPAVTFNPNPIDIGTRLTWSPAMRFTQDRTLNTPGSATDFITPAGTLDSLSGTSNSRTTSFNLDTPLRIGGFNWGNTIAVTDFYSDRGFTETGRVPDATTPDPNDSTTVDRFFTGDFSTGVDWNTRVSLPILFRGSWKVTPSVGIANVAAGQPFLLRNRATGGDFVTQSKRASFTLTATPTFFAFLPGFGPIARIRHSLLPTLSFNYSPEGHVPDAFARAITPFGKTPVTLVPQSRTASLGLTQTFEAKGHPAPGDTSATPNVRKYKLLSLTTGAVAYDFEQAKLPGRTGWVTQSLTNSAQSDLVPGLNISLTHDLWKGTVGTDSAVFSPYLTAVSASFGLNAGTFRGIARLLGFGPESTTATHGTESVPASYVAQAVGKPHGGSFGAGDQVQRSGRTPFSASFNFSLERSRPTPAATTTSPEHIALGFNTGFSPTPFWSMTWRSQYNFTAHRFEGQEIHLDRDLHEWRASFDFVRNLNGNVAFYFRIALLDLPDLKFDYNQTTLRSN